MPYKNPSEHFYPTIIVRIKKENSALYEGPQEAINNENVSASAYVQKAIREKLIRDGYILESDK